jgi:hypothetical protein
MLKNYNDKMMRPINNKALTSYYYPDLGLTIMAASKYDADKKALAITKKNAKTHKGAAKK